MDTEHPLTPELARPEVAIVKVGRQPGDHRLADYRLADVSRLRWDFVGGGMRQKSQWHVYGFVMCDGMVRGKVGHSCQHGPPPHKIKVCLTKKYNEKIWPLISEKVGLKPPSRHLKRNMKRKRRRDRKKLEASPVCRGIPSV